MKSLTDFINESINNKYLSKLNLTGIPQSSNEEFGKPQEDFVIDKLNISYPEYKWVSAKEYYGAQYNTQKDLVDGDILGLKDNKPVFFIDVKVSKNKDTKYVGSINLNSILNFGDENHYYLCVNVDGSKFVVKKSSEIKELFNNTDKCLKVTTDKDRNKTIEKSLDKYINKFIDSTEDVSYEDYMPSMIFNKK